MKKSKLFAAFFAATAVFSLVVISIQSLLCHIFSATCFDSPIQFTFPEIVYTALGLFIYGLIANIPFFIACFSWRASLLTHKKSLMLIATFGPILLMLLIFLFISRSMPQIQGDEWLYVLIVPCAGLLSGYAMFWAYNKNL
jgi:hypothetical protein